MDHSEVKHLPKVDHTPAELDEASQGLLRAAAWIEKHGLCQRGMYGAGDSGCIVVTFIRTIPDCEANQQARDRLRALVPTIPSIHRDLADWNESGVTPTEVLAKIRAAAFHRV